jgi:hypothetical protein
VHGQFALHGVDPLFSAALPPGRLDHSDYRLATGVNMDMLNRDFLLPLAAVAV